MLSELKGKGLFIFSDPGGAKPVLALVRLFKSNFEYKIISDRVYDFFADFGLRVEPYSENMEFEVLEKYKPDFVYTGTSYTSDIELKFIRASKQKNIPTYAFVDHYTSFLKRFQSDQEYIFPETICVSDEKARRIFTENKIDSNIVITANTYLEYLRTWKPSVGKDDFFRQTGIPLKNKLLVFAPEPFSNVGGVEVFGLDEETVLNSLINVINKGNLDLSSTSLFVKLHPNQRKEKLLALNKKIDRVHVLTGDNVHTNTLLYYADIVIGVFSNILVESSIFNKNIIRILIDLKSEDALAGNNIGRIVRTEHELEDELRQLLS